MRTTLHGTELSSLEVMADAQLPVPAPFAPTGEASLLLFSMHRLVLDAVPWVGPGYREALWRIGVTHESEVGWLAVLCDVDTWAVAVLGARVIRYATRAARITGEWRVEASAGAFEARVTPGEEAPAPVPPRKTFVVQGGVVYRVPWAEEPAPWRRSANVEVVHDSLSAQSFGGAVRFRRDGLVHRGRVHRCGAARRV